MLHAAAFIGDLALAEILMAHGADILIQTDDGKAARHRRPESAHLGRELACERRSS